MITLAVVLDAVLGGTVVWFCMVADVAVKIDDFQREAND